jgi:hypothetical protein
MPKNKINLIGFASLAILILIIFYRFSSYSLFDSDFWWHISTGRYIVTNNSIPDSDPFSFTSAMDENKNLYPERENFILKQYWLAQVIFYLIFEHTGAKGIILLRAILLTATLVIVLWRLQRWSVSFPVMFAFIFLLFTNLTRSTGERPVLFTIFFTAVAFFILEDFKQKKNRRIFLLAPLMFFWSNLHGGFIIGIGIIGVVMLSEGVNIIIKKSVYSRHDIKLFYGVSILAIICSYINPAGWDTFHIVMSSKYLPFTTGIQEYQSPLFYFQNKYYPIAYHYIIIACLFPLILLIRNKKFDFGHAVLLLIFLVASLSASRFTVYYAIIGAMILGKEADAFLKGLLDGRITERVKSQLFMGLAFTCVLSSLLFAAGVLNVGALGFNILKGSVPERAANFMVKNNIQGNIFNDYAYGGYLTWRLYPEKTFIDSRALNLTVMTEYGWVANAVTSVSGKELTAGKKPLWGRILENYNIDIILLSTLDTYGQVSNLIFDLVEGNEWVPVFCDDISVIFIKDTTQNREIIEKSRLTKETVYNYIILHALNLAMSNKSNYHFLETIAKNFQKMDRLNDALLAYTYALKRFPRPELQNEINKIEAELKMRDTLKK